MALAVPMALIAIGIKVDSRGPALFRQQRTGYMGRRFAVYKFRTMVQEAEALKSSLTHCNEHGADAIDFKVKEDPRVTRVGRWLRRTSLDELPNLFNVFVGDMRLVGPRPTSFDASAYNEHHRVRLSAYPGLTGLWQVSGRSDLDFDERVRLDRQYIEEQSPWLDLKILFATPAAVFTGKGAY